MSNTGKRLTKRQLNKILDLHREWSRGDGGVRADLKEANVSGADLKEANLEGAILAGVNLSYANLRWADLSRADLTGADLRWADLSYANLRGAILDGAKLPSPVLDLSNCKVGYKKVWSSDYAEQLVIELRFPEGARLVSTVTGRKCRASEAVVVRCVSTGHEGETKFWSMHDRNFIYRVGETVKPTEPFDDSITEECTSGIHFFVTQEEAETYR